MIVRLATTDDDAGITALMESVPMPGPVQLAFGCRPSFFQALRVEGSRPVVAVAEDCGEIVGVGAVTFRKVFLNGRVSTLRYLSALRVAPGVRGSAALARGFARLKQELAGRPADITLTSILADNAGAHEILTSGRASLPRYEPQCVCTTHVLDSAHAGPGPSVGWRIERGSDAGEIAGFLLSHGPSRNFFPVCQPEDFSGGGNSAFPGLTCKDFLVARDGGEILGVMGCWDVTRFRQVLVTGYSSWLRWARPWINLGGRVFGRPLLPNPGETLGLGFGALTLVVNDDLRIFRSLLDQALEWSRKKGFGRFVIATAGGGPLEGCFKGLRRREIHSRIYRVRFEETFTQTMPDGRLPHFEGAML